MALSRKAAEMLLDLVEVKLSCVEVYDRDDAKELALLEMCREELSSMVGQKGPAAVIPMARRGRLHATAH